MLWFEFQNDLKIWFSEKILIYLIIKKANEENPNGGFKKSV